MVPAPGGVNVALALADITKEGGGQKKSKRVVDDKFLSMVEDGVERPNIVIVSKVADDLRKTVCWNIFEKRIHYMPNAVQADDAGVQAKVWNKKVTEQLTLHWASKKTQTHLDPEFVKALEVIWSGFLQKWKQNVSEDFYKQYKDTGRFHPKSTDVLVAGQLAITKAEQPLFWECDVGSALFFSRWPVHYQEIACKGIAPMFNSDLPCRLEKQPKYKDEVIREKEKEKLEKEVVKGYIELTDINFIEAIMYMFHVAKGDDIFMVYNGSKSGLNTAMYAPWFALPTAESMTRWLTVDSWFADK